MGVTFGRDAGPKGKGYAARTKGFGVMRTASAVSRGQRLLERNSAERCRTDVWKRKLLAHYLNDHPFISLSIEFGIEDTLPRAKIQFSGSHRNYDLVVDQQ